MILPQEKWTFPCYKIAEIENNNIIEIMRLFTLYKQSGWYWAKNQLSQHRIM